VYLQTWGQSKIARWKVSVYYLSWILCMCVNWNNCFPLHDGPKVRHCSESWRRCVNR